MAPAEGSPYLPALEACLEGKRHVLSWRQAYEGITSSSHISQRQTLISFLNCPATHDALRQAINSNSRPAADSQTEFDSYTAAINIPQNGNGQYDVNEIKSDAQWLNKSVHVDLVSALRIVTLEWQTRPASKLESLRAENEPGMVRESGMHQSLFKSTTMPRAYANTSSNVDFDSVPARQARLFRVWAAESQYRYKCLDHAVSHYFQPYPAKSSGRDRPADERALELNTEVNGAAAAALESLGFKDGGDQPANWLSGVISMLRDKTKKMFEGCGAFQDDSVEEMERGWCITHATGAVYLLRAVLWILRSSDDLLSPSDVKAWFEFMDEVNFFDDFETSFLASDEAPSYSLRSLATLTSSSLLKISSAFPIIAELHQAPVNEDRNSHYLFSPKTVESLTEVLLRSAIRGSIASQPVALVWSILLQNMRAKATASLESREIRQSQRASEALSYSQVSDTESVDSYSGRARPAANRRTSFGSDSSQQASLLEGILDAIQKLDAQDDIIQMLARSAFTGNGAFSTISDIASTFCLHFGSEGDGLASSQIRVLLLQLVEASLTFVDYGSDIVSTVLAILTGGNSQSTRMNRQRGHSDQDPISYFLHSQAFMDRIFDQAVCRFPYELSPLLALCSALMDLSSEDPLGPFAAEVLRKLPSYATMIPENGYAIDEDDANYIILRTNILMDWSPRTPREPYLALTRGPAGSDGSKTCPEIQDGSRGLSLTDSKPVVARFDHTFDGYRFLGRILQRTSNAYFGSEKSQLSQFLEPTVEILSLLTGIFDKVENDSATGYDAVVEIDEILESLNSGLDDGNDLISTVFNILENELQEQHPTNPQGDPTELLVACIHFTQGLLQLQPSRVWPFLGRSSLLGIDGVESRLLSVVASREVPAGQFPLLKSSVSLFRSLIDDVVRHCASRRRVSSSALVRLGAAHRSNTTAGIKDAMMAKILYTFTKLMMDVFETAKSWRAVSNTDVSEIYASICQTLDEMLTYSFDVDDNTNLSEKLTGALAPAIEYAAGVFLFNHHNSVPIEPFIQGLEAGTPTSENALEAVENASLSLMTVSFIQLAEHLVRVNAYLGHARSQLEEQLFRRANLLIQVFASNEVYRLPITKLLHALLIGSGQGQQQQQQQPPSLLGHLGQEVAMSFIDLLAAADQPLGPIELSPATWRLLSAVVTQQQQWFAILILSGETAREYLRRKDCEKPAAGRSHSLLDLATSKLRHIEVLEPREALSILEFVSVAVDYWPWVSRKLEGNSALIKEFTSLIARIDESRPANSAVTSVARALRLQMAASITKILAVIVHRGNEIKDTSFAKQVAPFLKHLIAEAPSTTNYNVSLHSSLQRNFLSKFSSCSVANVKRTSVPSTEPGPVFYYDTKFASKVFGFDKSWARDDGQGFCEEFERANINLSYVQAQISLFSAWKSLAVEMALALGSDKTIQGQIANVVKACLEANQDSSLPEQVFGKLAHSRAELAFVLLQNLTQHSSTANEVQSIVAPAWNLLQSHASDLAVALSGPDAEYHRVLLKTLYLALESFAQSSSAGPTESPSSTKLAPSMTATILDILGNGVAQGFRSLVSLLHESPSSVLPVDLALLNAILRTCLHIPSIERQTEQLMNSFTDNNTTQYATALFSWADRLLVDGDPVYGSLSMAFLLELSTVPALAESIILSGSLGQLSASNLMGCFTRPGGSGPFEQPVRVHAIWSRGILPLAINLLHVIGAPIAGDVAAFLNQFQPQLERAVNSLAPKTVRGAVGPGGGRDKYVTLSTAAEVHSLAVLCAILDAFRDAGSGAGLAPGEVAALAVDRPLLVSDLENVLQRRNALRDDIVPMDAREEAWSRQKPESAQSGCENALEEKVVEELKAALRILSEGD